MPGDNHDILELIKEDDRPKVEKIIDLMKYYRPAVSIDRAFQRELKEKLMKRSGEKSFDWYPWLSSFGVVATSFLVFLGIWHNFSQKKPESRDAISTSSMTAQEKNIGDTLPTLRDGNLSTSETNSLSLSSNNQLAANTQSTPINQKKEPLIAEGSIPQVQGDTTSTQVLTRSLQTNAGVTGASDTNISSDIASISADINNIIDTMTTGGDRITGRQATTLAASTPPTGSTPTQAPAFLLPSYPSSLLVYTKNGNWTQNEILTRSGNGITSTKVATLSRANITETLTSLDASGNISISYALAKKEHDIYPSLVPILDYTTSTGEKGKLILISGYSLY